MTSSAPATTGVTIAAAGSSGMLTGNTGALGGLDGLFSSLVGASMPLATGVAAPVQAPVGTGNDGLISVLLGVQAGDANAVNVGGALDLGGLTNILTPGQGTVTQDVKLGDAPALTVTGDAETVKNFVQQLKDVYQKVVVEGGLTIGQLSHSKELAGALTKLGMSADEAAGVAERIETMMKLLKEQQDVDDATAGSLVAMMLTVMGQQAAGAVTPAATTSDVAQNFGLQIVSVEQAPVGTGTPKMTAWQMRAGSDVTRDLLGLGGGDKKAAEDAAPVADATRKIEVAVTADGAAAIAVGVPEVKIPVHAQLPVTATDAMPSEAAQAATAVTTTGAAVKVAADERIEAPKGETYYKLQADKNGVETLEAVKPASEMKDASLLTQQNAAAPTPGAAATASAADAANNAAFAERVAQIQAMVDKADVGKQVSVQMQPLLAEGGGTVRINLHPKDLGQITVELKVTDGKVQGTIAASEPAVVEQLARELHSLRHGLADAGLKLGEQGINLMLSNQNQNGQSGQNGRDAQNAQAQASRGFGGGTAGNGGATGDDLASNLAAWVAPDRMLDVNV